MNSSAAAPPGTIYLVSTTGNPNYGDELIAATWLRHLARIAPHSDVWMDCPNPGPSATLLNGLHPRVRFTDTFWRLCWEAPAEEPWEVSAFVQNAMNDPGLTPRWISGIELAARADLVHVIGGGYINEIWPRHYGLLAAAVAATRRSGGRAVLTGQGLWPAPEETRPLLRNLAGQFSLVDVRDTPSAEVLGDGIRTSNSGDDMFFGVQSDRYRDDDLCEFMLCLQSDLLTTSLPNLAGFVLDTLRSWGVHPSQVGVVEGIPRVDRELYSLVEHDLTGARFYPFSEVMERGLPAAEGQYWLSTRFHMHLMAAAVGADGVAISVNPDYYANKHRSLIERGSSWTLSEATDIPELPRGGGFPPDELRALQEDKAKLAWSIYGG